MLCCPILHVLCIFVCVSGRLTLSIMILWCEDLLAVNPNPILISIKTSHSSAVTLHTCLLCYLCMQTDLVAQCYMGLCLLLGAYFSVAQVWCWQWYFICLAVYQFCKGSVTALWCSLLEGVPVCLVFFYWCMWLCMCHYGYCSGFCLCFGSGFGIVTMLRLRIQFWQSLGCDHQSDLLPLHMWSVVLVCMCCAFDLSKWTSRVLFLCLRLTANPSPTLIWVLTILLC